MTGGAIINGRRRQIVDFANTQLLPSIGNSMWADAGFLVAYGPVRVLNRLVPSMLSSNIDAEQTQPRIGASVTLRGDHDEPLTVWLSAAAWEGAATLIRQTPDQCRCEVVEFLKVLHSSVIVGTPLDLLVSEVIREVRHDPYGDMPEDSLKTYDFQW
jgi:hypothetical protein